MNSCREFEGKNVEKAVELACAELNVSKNQLKYDIISNGSSGIFSIIRSKKAKIRVNLDNITKNKQKVLSLVDEAFGVNKPQAEKPERPEKTEPVQNAKTEMKNKKETPAPRQEQKPRPEQKKRPEPKPYKKPVVINEEIIEDEDDIDPSEYPDSPDKIISDFYKGKNADEIGREVLSKILEYVTAAFTITVDTDEESMTFHISSEDSAVIIGKRGQNLEAIQYIVDKIVNKHTIERRRVLIDVEGYLEKRRENLEKMAIRMSEKVKKTGKPSTISQMSSQDRRIVHLALKDNKNVRTQSMGEGYYRRLVIFPRKSKGRKKPE